MREDSNRILIYIKILILIAGIIFLITFLPKDESWEKLGDMYNPMSANTKNNSTTADPIKLQFRTGLEYDYNNIDKKNDFLEKKMKIQKDSDGRKKE
ncbi:MAG: hypothetical protein C0626_09790 [Arcobacter sp.]|uniref:hypothetical protein n=1 Tax=uncultured Arcobacter sp. TaxID=165434 RepID=UPI000CBDADDB|nr:hypothetical protein [uncultured Arcobacter sp.]PLY09279.1 MAG: hypothetical protein C0626_09790 [Arcobacter sp.]